MQLANDLKGVNSKFLFYILIGFVFSKLKPESALEFYVEAYNIKSNSNFLNYKIILLYKSLNNNSTLIDFYIKSLLQNKKFWKKDLTLLVNEIPLMIRSEKGDFFADRVIQQFSLPCQITRDTYLHHPYNFMVGLEPIEEYCQQSGSEFLKLTQKNKYTFSLPAVFGETVDSTVHELNVPESWIATLKDVELIAGYCVLKNKNIIIYEPAALPIYGHHVAGCRQYLQPINNRPDRANYTFSPKRNISYSEGILLSGRCSTNYYHWLIEHLPKFLEIDSHPDLKEVPLIVDNRMPIQHFQALEILTGGKRKLIGYDNENIFSFKKLIIPSVASYIPDRFDIPFWHSGVMSTRHLIYIRDKILAAVKSYNSINNTYPEKIYLSRKNVHARSMTNERKVESLFLKRGFQQIYLETLTFHEQVLYMQNAKTIAGPSGAGLSNLLFCNEGTEVISFTSERNKGFCNFSNLAKLNGVKFTYITGANNYPRSRFSSEEDYVHSSFTIPIDKVLKVFEELKL